MARFTVYHAHAIFLLAFLLFACINHSHPLTPPTTSSNTLVSPNKPASVPPSNNASSPEAVSERRLPEDPFTFDNDEGWAVKYTHWEEPSHPSDLVDDLLSGALTRLDRERGSRDWDRTRPRRSFFFSDTVFDLCFELQRLPSPQPPLTFEGVRVALQGAQYLADEFEEMVMNFEIYLYHDHIGGPLTATGFLGGTERIRLGGYNASSYL